MELDLARELASVMATVLVERLEPVMAVEKEPKSALALALESESVTELVMVLVKASTMEQE